MVLGVETALEEVQKLTKEIAELKNKILENKTVINAKKALKRTIKVFDINTQAYKLDKLARDINLYDKKVTYPYLIDDYYKQDSRGRYSTRGRGGSRRYTTFSESSGASDGESDNEEPSTSMTSGKHNGPNTEEAAAHGTGASPENEFGGWADTEAANSFPEDDACVRVDEKVVDVFGLRSLKGTYGVNATIPAFQTFLRTTHVCGR
ncbi:hypothetical protein NDU88_006586 [Pleurodeles waltl]|uniref:Uncharacterized protein n=1 Tax=Pleurodeles waltl TaxID=8319 RepID=A0AAV7VMB2_PLEWA|nr:hypothetical protein NDU88_006586 [Pleurodeles waltl]